MRVCSVVLDNNGPRLPSLAGRLREGFELACQMHLSGQVMSGFLFPPTHPAHIGGQVVSCSGLGALMRFAPFHQILLSM